MLVRNSHLLTTEIFKPRLFFSLGTRPYACSRMFVVSPFREIYSGSIVVCVFWLHSLLLRSRLLVYPLFFHTAVVDLLVISSLYLLA